MAREATIHLVIGVIERDGGTLSLHCAVLRAPTGATLANIASSSDRQRTPHLGLRRWLDAASIADRYRADWRSDSVGRTICRSCEPPCMPRALKSIALPDADEPGYRGSRQFRGISRKKGAAFLSCNQFARRRDYPADYPTEFGDEPETILSRGGGCVVGPLGQILAGPDYDGETILTADLDLAEIARARMDFDVVGTLCAARRISIGRG